MNVAGELSELTGAEPICFSTALVAGVLTMVKYNPDGSFDAYLQAKSPGVDKESNWLPIPPSGVVNVTIRIYDPKPEALQANYKIPPVTKVQ